MPGFTTHYLFGLNAYKALDNTDTIKQIIYTNRSVYSLGLQGPDIFFYYLPSYLFFEENPGSVAHTSKIGVFLSHLLNSYKRFSDIEDANIAKAYIMGFLGHYILDSKCHPYIYAKTEFNEKSSKYYGNHINLEVEIDSELLLYFKNKKSSDFRQEATILFTKQQKKVIATILYYVYSLTYPEMKLSCKTVERAIHAIQLGAKLLRDPSGRKKIFVRKMEGIFIGYPVLSSMIPSDRTRFFLDPLNTLHKNWRNPWDKDKISRESFFDLFDSAAIDFIEILSQTNEAFQVNQEDTLKILLHILGNNSYHSGLECTIPS